MKTCGLCGAPVRPPFQAPAAEMAPDLDGRPGEPARSTLPRWVATCRRCTAAAPDLSALPSQAASIVDSGEYRAQPGPFLRWAVIAGRLGDTAGAAASVLQAAWAADDAGADAAPLRRRAAMLFGPPQDTADALRLIDIRRRAGDMTDAQALANQLDPLILDENSARIVAFQRRLLEQNDTGRHLISSALRPPAHTPHVAHGRIPAGPGLWRRLFGGG